MEKDIINILIVDDEKYEGILIEKCVNWESEGFHIIGNVQCAEDAENHGLGILRVKKIVNQYGGLIDISEENSRFMVHIACV